MQCIRHTHTHTVDRCLSVKHTSLISHPTWQVNNAAGESIGVFSLARIYLFLNHIMVQSGLCWLNSVNGVLVDGVGFGWCYDMVVLR